MFVHVISNLFFLSNLFIFFLNTCLTILRITHLLRLMRIQLCSDIVISGDVPQKWGHIAWWHASISSHTSCRLYYNFIHMMLQDISPHNRSASHFLIAGHVILKWCLTCPGISHQWYVLVQTNFLLSCSGDAVGRPLAIIWQVRELPMLKLKRPLATDGAALAATHSRFLSNFVNFLSLHTHSVTDECTDKSVRWWITLVWFVWWRQDHGFREEEWVRCLCLC